jgi:hypothetical protein
VTADEFRHCVALVRVYWAGTFDPTVDVLNAWESLWWDLDAHLVVLAIQSLAGQGERFAPPPGLIRRRALELITSHSSGDEAWGQVVSQIAHTGRYREPQFDDAVVAQVVEAMGWKALCDSTNAVADRAHFMQMYREASERAQMLEALPSAARKALRRVTGLARRGGDPQRVGGGHLAELMPGRED